MTSTLCALSLLLSGTALAQVNTEKLRLAPADEGLTGSVALSLTSKTGNVEQFETSASVGVASRWGDNLAFAVLTSKYASRRKRADRVEDHAGSLGRGLFHGDYRFSNAHLFAARYNRFLSERFIVEVFGQAEYNQFLLLDLRALGGVGPRFVLFDQRADGYLGVAYMAEFERLDEDSVDDDEAVDVLAHRLTAYATFSVDLSEKASLVSTTYAQPRLTDLGDTRIYNESTLSVEVTEALRWDVSFTLRHDTDPPALKVEEGEVVPEDEEHLRSTDTAVVNKISLSW